MSVLTPYIAALAVLLVVVAIVLYGSPAGAFRALRRSRCGAA